MQIPSCVSIVTVIDISHFSLYCSSFLLVLLKAMDRSHQGHLSKSVGWNNQLQHQRPGNKTMLVLCNRIKCLQAVSFNNSGRDWDCHSVCVFVSCCGVFSFSCLTRPRGKSVLRQKQSRWTWDTAGTSTCSSHHPYPESQDPETLTQSTGSRPFVSVPQSLQKEYFHFIIKVACLIS